MTERELVRELAEHGSLLAVGGYGLLYGAVNAGRAACPHCGRAAAFYVIRQATIELVAELSGLGRPELGWSVTCLVCSLRDEPPGQEAPSHKRQEPPGAHVGQSSRNR